MPKVATSLHTSRSSTGIWTVNKDFFVELWKILATSKIHSINRLFLRVILDINGQ